MLGNRIIGLMESLAYEDNQPIYQQSYEVVSELKIKINNEYSRFVKEKREFLQHKDQLHQTRGKQQEENVQRFEWVKQAIAQFDLAFFKQQLSLPTNQGSIILFQALATACHMDILDDLIQYYSVDALLEQIEIGLKYLGREEEVFKGLDLYYMLKETAHVMEIMNRQIDEYLLLQNKLQEKMDKGLKELEALYLPVPGKKHKKINFYRMGYEQRDKIGEVYAQIQVLEKMNKLPLYKGSLGANHLFMNDLMAHLEQVN